MKRQLTTLIVISVFMLTACGTSAPAQPTATLTFAPTLTRTATSSPTFTPTPEPTFTPTSTPTPRLPVSIGTKIPNYDLTLSTDNLDKITELARWGKGVITDAGYSPDGKLIAIATTLGITLYRADSLEEVLDFETGTSVNSLAFSPNGETIATGLNDNTLKLWKASDGSLLRSLDGHHDEKASKKVGKEEITSVSFSPDGNLIIGGSTDGTVSVWQVADGSLINTLKNHTSKVTSVFFSPDGQFLFSGSWDGLIRMTQTTDWKPLRKFSSREIDHAAISTDGKILAAYDQADGNLIVWNVEDGTKITKFYARPDSGEITGIALSPDRQYIAAGLENHTAKYWSINGNVLQSTFEDLQPKEGRYYYSDFAVAFSPDGGSMLMAGSDMMGVWDVKKGALLNSAEIKSESIYTVALSPDGQTLASVEGTNVNLWQVSDGSAVSLKDTIQTNGDVAFSADGASLLTSLFDNTARIWPVSEQGARHSFEMEKKDYISGIAFSPDGKFLALGTGYPGRIELRQVEDGALIKSIKFSTNYYYLYGVAFSPNGDFLAAVDYDKIVLFQVSDGKTVKSFKAGFGLAFSPDNTLLAGGGKDKMLQVWKIPSGEPLFAVKDQPENVDSVVFSPDGTLLVSGSEDGTIQVFRMSDGSLLKKWKGHSRWISDLLFSSDGKLLISSSADGTIRVWGIKP